MKNTNTQQTKLFKILVLFASILLMVLLLVGLTLTFTHKSLLKKQQRLNESNNQIDVDIDNLEKETEFLTGKDGEVIINH